LTQATKTAGAKGVDKQADEKEQPGAQILPLPAAEHLLKIRGNK